MILLLAWATSSCATGRGAETRTVVRSTEDCSLVGSGVTLLHHAWPGALLASGCDTDTPAGNVQLEITPRRALLTLVSLPEDSVPSAGNVLGGRARRLVERWPALDREPFLGHNVLRIAVLDSARIEVVFRDSIPVSEVTEDRVRLFADPRLGFVRDADRSDPFQAMVKDGRTKVDRGEAVPTVHLATLEYAFAAGREIDPMSWGVAYVLAAPPAVGASDEGLLAGRAQPIVDGRPGAEVAAWVAQYWENPSGQDRVPWESLYLRSGDRPQLEHCPGLSISPSGAASPGPAPNGAAAAVVYYREGDEQGRAIAERVVSASLRSGPEGALVESWLGIRASEGLRAVSLNDSKWDDALRDGAGIAFVVPLPWGPMSYCSILGEVGRRMPWAFAPVDTERFFGSPRLSPIGISYGFAIREAGADQEVPEVERLPGPTAHKGEASDAKGRRFGRRP